MAATTYLANKILDHAIGKTAFTMPTIYVGLMTANPTAAGTQTAEANYTSYARIAAPGSSWASATAGTQTNSAALNFPASTGGSTQTATHWALFDAATAGNMTEFGALSPTISISTGVTPNVPAGDADRSAS